VNKQVSTLLSTRTKPSFAPARSGYNTLLHTPIIHNTSTMYRQATLARTALRATRARGYATAAETAPEDFAATRKAVRAHAVGMSL
jgi:hypothetical protein